MLNHLTSDLAGNEINKACVFARQELLPKIGV